MTDSGYTDRIIRDHIGWLADGASESYFGPETALLAYGRPMAGVRDRPAYVPAGQKRQCYANCVKAVLPASPGREELFYAEGFATTKPGQLIPMQHAWLVDQQGHVIDPTWGNAHEHLYFGVVFKTSFVIDMLCVADMVPGILSTPVLMRQNLGTRSLFEAALEQRYHPLFNSAADESSALRIGIRPPAVLIPALSGV
ncbi:hypothetical protein N2600_18190 [Rhizobium sp. WSM1274]|uniref:hypothetical protein n=1 Tax=Rhizobium sp. WSM1274 TaxID=3138254 RepID=UPI0021A83E0C|nr:hypothetical protein [Rhizobium leguminosarum]UWU27285.1 hypothetical protein N2600_18190 [Rhizobium leguminosarum bv. viciae]